MPGRLKITIPVSTQGCAVLAHTSYTLIIERRTRDFTLPLNSRKRGTRKVVIRLPPIRRLVGPAHDLLAPVGVEMRELQQALSRIIIGTGSSLVKLIRQVQSPAACSSGTLVSFSRPSCSTRGTWHAINPMSNCGALSDSAHLGSLPEHR